ncbi:hypothetical protein DCAR_0100607 [Daucus carota subsp. sativus]|uniref:Uncharacterized protein n=1 Tax=Daucus carota subsp. sativus TaxID=79200 RepID=A0A166FSV5_DAUCS|nr:hypothetical protein DCAR_0100607 [Daucus carota subsp. sativus]
MNKPDRREYATKMDERVRAKAKFNNIVDDIHRRTIEDVLYFNSLLTFAVFIGLSQTYEANRSQEKGDECTAGPGVHRKLIICEVLAFACFLSSSLSAKALKLLLTSHENKRRRYIFTDIPFQLKTVMLIATAGSSLMGMISLVFSVVFLVQIQIGYLASYDIRDDPGQEEEISGATDTELQRIGNSGNRIDVG